MTEFSQMEGLESVNPKYLESFLREMRERVIPAIVENQYEQKKLAQESRRKIIRR